MHRPRIMTVRLPAISPGTELKPSFLHQYCSKCSPSTVSSLRSIRQGKRREQNVKYIRDREFHSIMTISINNIAKQPLEQHQSLHFQPDQNNFLQSKCSTRSSPLSWPLSPSAPPWPIQSTYGLPNCLHSRRLANENEERRRAGTWRASRTGRATLPLLRPTPPQLELPTILVGRSPVPATPARLQLQLRQPEGLLRQHSVLRLWLRQPRWLVDSFGKHSSLSQVNALLTSR